ncbi:NAD-dependent succinate-semialdehyde dehydrogenase [Hyphococcus sp.]|jgi:succinate-semialdehyde dehydrogenase/glutarate-semialdehyde dehydrogenase|uniref:NAD-dependent succinate-semialdehyde dehydrogenase n=1 Tax=Hyphococcus sp. TaxID=2038636 RepID=UPI003D0E5303
MKYKLIKTRAYIGGSWLSAESGAGFPVFNPATGEEIARVADCGADDAARAIEAAAAAFPEWSRRTGEERSRLLKRWRDLIIGHEEELAQIITLEMGKPYAEALGEVRYGASYVEWFAEEAKRIYGDVIPNASRGARTIVLKQPVGVCAAITPWNFPNAMLMRKVAPALGVGCTMVAKPAEDTPLSALAIAALGEEAGLPPGVFNVVPSARPQEVGGVLATHPAIRKISFTGSTETGRLLLRQSAETVKKASMELGGNAPFIVFDDADLDSAVAGAMASKYRNGGQTCVCANRIFVQQGVYDAFAERLAAQAASLKVGPGDEEGAEIGPLINIRALEKVDALVRSAVGEGAKALTGGGSHDLGGLFYAPTVLTGVRNDMEIARAEIFGPVASIIPFDGEDDVIRAANDTIYGLAAYLYTRDLGRAFRVGEALEYGMVGVNEGVISSAAAPFGGVKQSGLGREGSKYGVEDYLEMKYICLGGLGR